MWLLATAVFLCETLFLRNVGVLSGKSVSAALREFSHEFFISDDKDYRLVTV